MEKIVSVGEKKVVLRATAALPRVYRSIFGRDVFKDITPMLERYQKIDPEKTDEISMVNQIGDHDMETLENLTFAMAWMGMPDVQTMEPLEWFDGFSSSELAVMEKEAFTLWVMDNYTIEETKKKAALTLGK